MKIINSWLSCLTALALAAAVLTACGGGNSFPTATIAPQIPPPGVTATPGDSQVSIAWTAVAGATSYNIYWATSPGVTPANGTKIKSTTIPYIQTGLTNGTTYYYVVTAANVAGESSPSLPVSAVPSATPPTPSGGSGPFIQATFLGLSGGTNPLGWLQQVYVFTNNSSTKTPITSARVTMNDTILNYNAAKTRYEGTLPIPPRTTVTLSVTVGLNTYTASATQYTTFPVITSPLSGATWSGGTITWTAGAPTLGATYAVGVVDDNTHLIAYPAGNTFLNVSTSSTTATVPGGSLATGNYHLFAAIATAGMPNNTAGIPIPNAAAGSALWIGGISAFVPVIVP